MSSNISGQINDFVPSCDLKDIVVSSNISNEKSNKPSSDSNSKDLWNSVVTMKTNILIPTSKELTEFLRTILKSILPLEKFKKYEEFEDYFEEKVRKEIIKDIEDIANDIKNLKEKVEELNSPKNMVSVGLNTDINFEYINLKEMMKEFQIRNQIRNNELLSKVSNSEKIIKDLKKEISRLTKHIENIDKTKKNISIKTSERNIFKTEFPIIKSKKYNNESPPLDNKFNSRNTNKKRNTIFSQPKKNKSELNETLSQRKDIDRNIYNYKSIYQNNKVRKLYYKSKNKSKSKLKGNNVSKENISPLYIISLKPLESTNINDNKKQ